MTIRLRQGFGATSLAELNARDRAAFVAALGWIFEDSPWVAERAWERRPFESFEALHAAMTQVVAGATEAEQLALLRAHPDLGTRARISDASTGEQRGAGLDRLTPDEWTRLQRLNDEYRRRFGFPFLFAVKGSTKHDVLAALESRTTRTRDEEFAEALQQVYKIARFRLEELAGG
jgi:2-oxo-4-hydroxy-4-carboxy-5-ureidoimidazoline decarboxylase